MAERTRSTVWADLPVWVYTGAAAASLIAGMRAEVTIAFLILARVEALACMCGRSR